MRTRLLLCLATLACLPMMAAADGNRLPAMVVRGLEVVVSVEVREIVKLPTFRNGRFRNEEVAGVGAGSGVVISADGLILTNAHVVAGSTEVRIGFASGRTAAARLISVDEASDLALLLVPHKGLKAIPFASGDPPERGAAAFVIGNRAGRGHQIARARIGPHRLIRVGARPLEFWDEVEAQVGPGNSGGAVLNTDGELLGIPSLLVRYTEAGERPGRHSSGLFIPIAHVRRAVERMLDGPGAVWPWLGLVLDDPLLATAEGRVWPEGAAPLVRSVLPGSPAAEAGFLPGDRILAIGARNVRHNSEALDAVLDLSLQTGVPVRVERDGTERILAVVTAERPADPRPDPIDDFLLHTGLRLQPRPDGGDGIIEMVFQAMSRRARLGMPAIEAELFAEQPILASVLPGDDMLEGRKKRIPINETEDLAAIIERCFVQEQFVAMGHWSLGGRRTLDRAQVHRKIYPFVI